MSVTYDAGIATSYAAAVAGGYTGTKEQYYAEQAQFAINAQRVAQDRAAVEQTVTTFNTTTAPKAIQDVTDEGNTQVQRVENKGDEYLEDIDSRIDDAVADLKDALSEKIQTATSKEYLGAVEYGKWKQSNGNDYTTGYGLYCTASVVPNTKYYASGTSVNSSFPLVVLFDANNSVIGTKRGDGSLTAINDYEFTTPENCTKVVVNGNVAQYTGGNYPNIYHIVDDAQTGNGIASELSNRQPIVYNWKKSTYINESDKYALVRNSKIEISTSSATGYNYSRLTYDKTKKYRFYGVCRTDLIPAVICCDSENQIIKRYDMAQTEIAAKEYDDIPEITYFIYVNGYGNTRAVIEEASARGTASFESGKVGVFFGDSITQGLNVYQFYAKPYQDYPSIAGNYLNCTIYNGGLGGSTFSAGRSIDFKNVVDCIVSGNFNSIYSGITEYGLDVSATLSYQEIENLDFSTVDFVSIALGTNDFSFEKTVADVKAAMGYCLEKLITNFPNLKVYVFTPIYRFNIGNSGQDADTYVNPATNLTLHQICDAIMDEAKVFNVPCKDMYYNCNINQYNKSLYMGDGTHPNENGYAMIGEKIAKFIDAN